jgi:hypothetical protein
MITVAEISGPVIGIVKRHRQRTSSPDTAEKSHERPGIRFGRATEQSSKGGELRVVKEACAGRLNPSGEAKGIQIVRQKIRYERPALIDMSMRPAEMGATTCVAGTGAASCGAGSCIRNATCSSGNSPTYCGNGGFTYGTCSYCNGGAIVDGYFTASGCGMGGQAAFSCTPGGSAGYSCGSGTSIIPCEC